MIGIDPAVDCLFNGGYESSKPCILIGKSSINYDILWNSGQSLAIETVLVIIKSRRNPTLSKIIRVFRQDPRYFYIFLPILKVRVRCGLGTGQCGLSMG